VFGGCLEETCECALMSKSQSRIQFFAHVSAPFFTRFRPSGKLPLVQDESSVILLQAVTRFGVFWREEKRNSASTTLVRSLPMSITRNVRFIFFFCPPNPPQIYPHLPFKRTISSHSQRLGAGTPLLGCLLEFLCQRRGPRSNFSSSSRLTNISSGIAFNTNLFKSLRK